MRGRRLIAVLLGLTMVAGSHAAARNAPAPLPAVIAADAPRYPAGSVKAGASGTVLLTVATDGAAVTSVRVMGLLTPLAGSAVRNLKTWRFAAHTPTTFDVSYRFSIIERSCASLGRDTHAVATMHFPTTIDVFAEVDPVCSGAAPPTPVF